MGILKKEELHEMHKKVTQTTNSEEKLGNEEERIEILNGIHPEMTSPTFPLVYIYIYTMSRRPN